MGVIQFTRRFSTPSESSKSPVKQALAILIFAALLAPALALILTTQVEVVAASPDDNFGYDNIGELGSDTLESYIRGSVFTCPSWGTADNITVYIDDPEGYMKQGALFKHSDNTLLANGTTESIEQYIDHGWMVFTFPTPPTLEADTEYVPVLLSDGPVFIYYDAGDTDQGHYQNGNQFPGSYPSTADFTHSNKKYSIYVSYTPSDPPFTKPILVSPENASSTSDNTPTFLWENGTGADNNRIEVSDNENFIGTIDNVVVLDNTWTKTGDGYAVGAYYWRVVAIDSTGGENVSENTWTFEISAYIYATVIYAGDVDEDWVNSVHMPQDNMKVKVHVTRFGIVAIENVILEWYDNGSWENYAMADNGGDNYVKTMSSLENERDYSFDVWVIGDGIENELQWLRKDNTGAMVRRYVRANYSPDDNLDYKQFYLTHAYVENGGQAGSPYGPILEHEQEAGNPTSIDWSYMDNDYPPDDVYGYCSDWVATNFNENLTMNNTVIDNIYYYIWMNITEAEGDENEPITLYYQKQVLPRPSSWDDMFIEFDNVVFKKEDNKKEYPISGHFHPVYILQTGFWDVQDVSWASDNIYRLHFEMWNGPNGYNIEWLGLEGIASFFIFNLPDNSTLAGMDSDSDGWDDNYELYTSYTNPFQADTDADGLQDNVDSDPLIPTPPTLHLPENNSETVNLTYFEWKMAVNADNHRLLVDNDEDFSSPNENRFFITDNHYTLPLENALPRDNYWWKVIASYAGTERVSDVWTFEVRWFLMESWSGTVEASPAEWNLIENWTGSVVVPRTWELLETWTGTLQNPAPPSVENLYITDMDNVATDDLIPQTQYKFWAEVEDNETLADIENVTLVVYLDNENLPDAAENHYTFRWTRDGGFEEVGPGGSVEPSVVGTSTSIWAISNPIQRKSFYANELFWVFYFDGTNVVYKTSTDGSSWSDSTTVRSGGTFGHRFSVAFDGTYVHYAYATPTSNEALYYRSGTPLDNGDITWRASEQIAVEGTADNAIYYPTIDIDSSGCPWIGYRRGSTPPNFYPYVTKSSTDNGTWTTAENFPYQLSSTGDTYWTASIVALTENRMLALYAYKDTTVKAKRYDGSSWGAEVQTTSNINNAQYDLSAVSQVDDVHVTFLEATTHDILYTKYVYSSNDFASESTVQSGVTSTSSPVLSIDTVTNNLYCFWAGSPTANHVFYKKNIGGTWDSTPTDWIDESTENLKSYRGTTGFDQSYSNKIGFGYQTKVESPYDVKFVYLNLSLHLITDNCVLFDNTLTLDNIVFAIEFGGDATVTDADNWDVWVQVYDSAGDQDNGFFLNRFDIVSAAQWTLLETWTGTVEAPAAWQEIENWSGSVETPAGWQLIETWTGTVEAPAEWQLVETWTGTIEAPVGWDLIEEWSGTLQAPSAWSLIETWSGTVEAPVGWSLIEEWTGALQALVGWQLMETWTGTVEAVSQWTLIETWSGTIQAPSAWQLIETWTGTIEAPAQWELVETWTGSIEASIAWTLIESWSGTVQAPAAWDLIETWSGTVEAPTAWNLIEQWSGTVIAPVGWNLIEEWSGTVQAPTAWLLLESWSGTVEAPSEWQQIESWAGTVEAPTEWTLVESWAGTVEAPVAWQLVETWSGTVEAFSSWQLVEEWTGTVENPVKWNLIETWTGTITAPSAYPAIYLTLQGSESDATITTNDVVEVEGWKDSGTEILSLFRENVICHEGEGITTEYDNCNGSIGYGRTTPVEVFYPDLAQPNFVFGDINVDGVPDVVAISTYRDNSVVLNTWAKAFSIIDNTLIWERTDLYGMAVIGDANSDGENEVIIATDYGYYIRENSVLYMVSGDNGENIWFRDNLGVIKRTYPGSWEGDIVIGDVDNDGLNEVIVGTENGLFVLNGEDGSTLWNYTEYPEISKILLVDIDNDNVDEIITSSDDIKNIFALSAVTKTKLWDNTDENVSLLAAKVGYINPDGIPDLIAVKVNGGSNNLVAYSLDNGTIMWISDTYMGITYSQRPPDLMDINGDGYKDAFATSDTSVQQFFSGENGTSLKYYVTGHNHFLDFDEEREIVIVAGDELNLRLVRFDNEGDNVWNVDAGVGLYEEYEVGRYLGLFSPIILGDHVFGFLAKLAESPHESCLLLVRLSDGYIFRKYLLEYPTGLSWDFLPYIIKLDVDNDGVDEIVIPQTSDFYIVDENILYDNEIYEPSTSLSAGTYIYTLNLHDDEGNLLTSVSRTLTVNPAWQLIETWSGSIQAPTAWLLLETWSGSVQAPAEWLEVESWTGTVIAVGWQLIETWDGTIRSPAFNLIETWTGSVRTLAVYAVSVSITPSENSGTLGDTLTYTVIVVNIGGTTDNYDLLSSDALGWVTYLDNDNFLDVPSGENRETTLNVALNTIENHTITVTATSQGDAAVSDSATCTAISAAGYPGVPIGGADVALAMGLLAVAIAICMPFVLVMAFRRRREEGEE